MNIEKKIVARSTKLSSIAKKTIAATFGLSAAFTLNACDDSSSPTSGQVVIPTDSSSSEENHEPLGDDVGPKPIEPQEPPQTPTPESSNSDAFSSSSKYLDIPQSHEAISSEVFEALSSAAQPAANSSATTPASSAVQPANSSAAQPASSSANAPTSAAQPLSSTSQVSSSTATPASSVNPSISSSSELSSSAAQPASSAAAPASSAAQPASSAVTQPANSSSSNNGWNVYPQDNPCEGVPDGTVIENGFQVIICPIPSSSSNGSSTFPGFSMVTTFELDDVMV